MIFTNLVSSKPFVCCSSVLIKSFEIWSSLTSVMIHHYPCISLYCWDSFIMNTLYYITINTEYVCLQSISRSSNKSIQSTGNFGQLLKHDICDEQNTFQIVFFTLQTRVLKLKFQSRIVLYQCFLPLNIVNGCIDLSGWLSVQTKLRWGSESFY